jgi:hypothetical protein
MSTIVSLSLGLRFLLELAGLGAIVYWGVTVIGGVPGWGVGLGLAAFAAAMWGTFRVPDDPGPAPIAVPGPLRLALEAVFFGTATLLLAAAGQTTLAVVFALLVALQYLTTADRVRRLLAIR